MIIGKPKAPNATFLGRPYLAPLPARPAEPQLAEHQSTQPGSAEVETTSSFEGRLGLRRICERLEQNIEALGDDVLQGGARGADKKIVAMFGEFVSDADKLVGAMAPGSDRDAVAQAMRRDGTALLGEAVATLDTAGERHAADQIASVRDGLVRRVAADPSRLASARKTLEELADAGELSDAGADTVKREGIAALEAAAANIGSGASPDDTVTNATPPRNI